MGFSIRINVTLPKREFSSRHWLDGIATAQRQTTVRQMKDLFKQTVFGWSKKPDFGWTQTINSSEISIKMYPQGQAADIWNLVSSGSPPHDIFPRHGGFLRFRTGYRAATRPGSLQSQRAYRSGKYVGASRVRHPGFEARNFPELIAQEYADNFAHDMQDAVTKAARG